MQAVLGVCGTFILVSSPEARFAGAGGGERSEDLAAFQCGPNSSDKCFSNYKDNIQVARQPKHEKLLTSLLATHSPLFACTPRVRGVDYHDLPAVVKIIIQKFGYWIPGRRMGPICIPELHND